MKTVLRDLSPGGRRGALTALAACVVAVVTAAGCGSSSGGGASTSSSASYKVMYESDLTGNGGIFKGEEQAFVASVKAANARGGIHGHKIDLVICDSQSSDNGAAECGQEAVSDHVIGVVSFPGSEGTEIPYLQTAKIPLFNIGSAPQSWTSSISFIINNAALAVDVGFPALLKQGGCKSFDTIQTASTDTSELASFESATASAAKEFGLTDQGFVFVPSSAPAMSPYITEAVHKGVDCVVAELMGAQELSALTSLSQLTQIKRIALGGSNLAQGGVSTAANPVMNQLGSRVMILSSAEGANDTSNPLVKEWVSDVTKYSSPNKPDLETISGNDWAELQLIIKAADAEYPNVTGPSLIKWLDTDGAFWPGVSPPVNFSKPVHNSFGPRVFSAWVAPAKWVDGGNILPRSGPFVSLIDPGLTNNNTGL